MTSGPAGAERGGEARSLFGEILDWMFAPLLLLWPMSVTLTYLVAQSIASSPYDRALVDRGAALAAHVRFEGTRARFDLTAGLLDVYGTGVGESGTYVVAASDGTLLAGDADLPRPPSPAPGGRPGPSAAVGATSARGAARLAADEATAQAGGGVAAGDATVRAEHGLAAKDATVLRDHGLAANNATLPADHSLAANEATLRAGAADGGASSFVLHDATLRGHPVRVADTWVSAPADAPGPPVYVAVAEPPTERTELANEIVKGVILPQFIVLPLALLLVWFGLTRGLAPLARLQQTIRKRPPDDLSPIRADSAPEELGPLLASFNDLLARMSHNLAVQQRFIADAAHQLKTPLAGLRTQAELAQRGGDTQELQRSLRQIAASTERATRLVNQLLALARAEHDASAAVPMRLLDLDALARSVVRDWVGPALAQGIDLGYEGPGEAGQATTAPSCRVLGAALGLRELLNNLIDNALRYTAGHAATLLAADAGAAPQGTLGYVTVRVRREADEVLLEVEDTGPGIAPEERGQVFERFYRVLGSRQDGSGLGLAIVREIATQHGARIQLFEASARAVPAEPWSGPRGPGACFCIRFSAADAIDETVARSV